LFFCLNLERHLVAERRQAERRIIFENHRYKIKKIKPRDNEISPNVSSVSEVLAKPKFAERNARNPSANEHFASAEHRIFAKQKAERSDYTLLGAVFFVLVRGLECPKHQTNYPHLCKRQNPSVNHEKNCAQRKFVSEVRRRRISRSPPFAFAQEPHRAQ
jgi:hypothetical protein